jgi:hypothetical protein
MDLLERLGQNELPQDVLKYAKESFGAASPEVAWFTKNVLPKYKGAGNLYRVDLPDEHIAKMLDWDKPLSQQPEHAKAFEKAFKDYAELFGNTPETKNAYKRAVVALNSGNMTGAGAYQSLAGIMGGKADAATVSNVLKREYNIPGIRYLDQGSRAGGQGTSNFVVFDDQLPKIIGRE